MNERKRLLLIYESYMKIGQPTSLFYTLGQSKQILECYTVRGKVVDGGMAFFFKKKV